MNITLIMAATLVICSIIVIIAGYIWYIINKPSTNPAQWKLIRDIRVETGTDPITGSKITHTHTEEYKVRV